jgi:hypothetical protein
MLSPVLTEVSLNLYCIWSQFTDSTPFGTTVVSRYTYRQHVRTISPSHNQLRRETVRTSLYCPGCHRPVEVVTKEGTYAKFPKELIRSDDSLFWKLLANILSRYFFRALLACATFVALVSLVVLSGVIQGAPPLQDAFPYVSAVIGGACGLILVALAIIKSRMLIGDFLIWRDDSVVWELGNLRTPFAKTILRKCPCAALVRTVSALRVIDTSRHAVSGIGGEFRARSHRYKLWPAFCLMEGREHEPEDSCP